MEQKEQSVRKKGEKRVRFEPKEDYKTLILTAIKKHKLMRLSHVFSGFVDFTRQTAVNYGLDQDEEILTELAKNRMKATNYMIQKWIQSENPTLQIAAMRMVCESEDRQRLAINYVDHTTKGDKINDMDKIKEAFLESLKINDKTE